MTYPRNWDANDPPGATTAAKLIDDKMRVLREDLFVRVGSLLAGGTAGINNDPLVLKADVTGSTDISTPRVIMIPPSIFGVLVAPPDVVMNTTDKYGYLYIPVGHTIIQVDAWMKRDASAGQCNCRLVSINPETGTETTIGTAIRNAGTTFGLVSVSGLTHVVTATELLAFRLFTSGGLISGVWRGGRIQTTRAGDNRLG